MRGHSPSRAARAIAVVLLSLQASCADRQVVAPATQVTANLRAALLADPAPAGFALVFDGSTSRAGTADGAPVTTQIDNIRYEAWVRWSGPAVDGQLIVYNGHSAVSGWGIFVDNETGKIAVLAGGIVAAVGEVALSQGTWQHVTAQRIAGDISVAVDGATFDFGPVGVNPVGGAFSGVERTTVGQGTGDGGVFNGRLDDVRISTTAGALIERWGFDEGAGDVAHGDNGAQLLLSNIQWRIVGTPIAILVNPGDENKNIDPELGGKIDVAVLSDAGFDASTIDVPTARFVLAAALGHAEKRDVNKDGRRDLVLTFDLAATGISCMDLTAEFAAKTLGGEALDGEGALKTLRTRLPSNMTIVRCDAPRVIATDLTNFGPSGFGQARGINDRGDVFGSISNDAGPAIFRWNRGEMTQQTPTEADGFINATAMNKHGDIVGTMFLSDRAFGFIWQHGTLTDLAVEGFSTVRGVNAERQVVGTGFTDEAGLFGFHWADGTTTRIGGTEDMPSTTPIAINQAGQIAGTFRDAANVAHAFLWQAGILTDLSASALITIPVVNALNDEAKVVGSAIYPADNRRYPTMWTAAGSSRLGTRQGTPVAINAGGQVLLNRVGATLAPFIWTDGAEINLELRSSGPNTTTARALNDLGQAAGNSGPSGVLRAVFWNADGSAIDLTGGLLLTTSSSAVGLNNRGQVVGSYQHSSGETRAVLWTLTWGHSDAGPH